MPLFAQFFGDLKHGNCKWGFQLLDVKDGFYLLILYWILGLSVGLEPHQTVLLPMVSECNAKSIIKEMNQTICS